MGLKLLLLALFVSFTFEAYVQTVAKELVTYAIIAYRDSDAIKNWNAPQCAPYKINNITLFSYQPKNLFGFVGYSQSLKAIVISFRGTEGRNLPNIVTDITLYKSKYAQCSGCEVHSGYKDGIRLLTTAFIQALQKVTNVYPNASIYIAGHSLGGALASLAAPIIRETFPNNPIVQIITAGKPRVGNKQYADWFNSIFDAYRVVSKNDIVPHLPFSGAVSIFYQNQATHFSLRNHLSAQKNQDERQKADYFHEGKQVWYNPNWNTFRICEGEDSSCMNSIGYLHYSISDHLGANYIQMTASAIQL